MEGLGASRTFKPFDLAFSNVSMQGRRFEPQELLKHLNGAFMISGKFEL
jgi:hypothetical protein